MSPTSTVSIEVDDSDPRDPTALCDRCGTRGTIARAMRHTEPPLILRYCGPCWPEAQREIEARQREEQEKWRAAKREWSATRDRGARESSDSPPGWSSNSRSWHDVSRFVSKVQAWATIAGAPAAAQLAEIVAEIREKASEMDGPMPADVEDFLRKYTPPSS